MCRNGKCLTLLTRTGELMLARMIYGVNLNPRKNHAGKVPEVS